MINKLIKSSIAKNSFSNIPKFFFSAEYDCVIIGGGPGGYVSAIKAG